MALVFKFQPFATWITWSKSRTFIGKGRCNTTSVNCENLIEESHKIFIRYKLYYCSKVDLHVKSINLFLRVKLGRIHLLITFNVISYQQFYLHRKNIQVSIINVIDHLHISELLSVLGQQRKVCSFHIFLAFLSLYKVYIVLESALPQHVFKDNIVNQKSGERCIIRFLSFPLQIQIQKARMVVI